MLFFMTKDVSFLHGFRPFWDWCEKEILINTEQSINIDLGGRSMFLNVYNISRKAGC